VIGQTVAKIWQFFQFFKMAAAAISLVPIYRNFLPNRKRKIRLKKCVEFAHNSQKWCTEFAIYTRRIFIFFGAEF